METVHVILVASGDTGGRETFLKGVRRVFFSLPWTWSGFLAVDPKFVRADVRMWSGFLTVDPKFANLSSALWSLESVRPLWR